MAKSSNNLVNPNAREAMNRFKMEAASEVGVPTTANNYTFYQEYQYPTCFCSNLYRSYEPTSRKHFPTGFFYISFRRRKVETL